MRVREYLIHQRGFSGDPRDMVILTEDAHNWAHIPTHDNMIAAMQWLVGVINWVFFYKFLIACV